MLFGDDATIHAEQTKLAHLEHGIVRDPAVFLPPGRVGCKFVACELARHVANHALLFGIEIDVHSPVRQQSGHYRLQTSGLR
jgi:hypothetical protein